MPFSFLKLDYFARACFETLAFFVTNTFPVTTFCQKAPSLGSTIMVLPAVPRVTLTLPCLNGARDVLFLVAGADKRPVVAEILQGGEAARRYPAAMVTAAGRTLWMIEQSAMPPNA